MAVGLYVHVPFCLKKCSYCDFVSFTSDRDGINLYLSTLAGEISLYADILGREERQVTTLYIGGGTPTCLETADLANILEAIMMHFNLSSCREISVEANPGTVSLEKLRSLRRLGVNRISIGMQSCSDKHLKNLGRVHNFRETVEAVDTAGEAGFDNIGADLIYGLPGQTEGEWRECLKIASDLGLRHISAYSLQVEEGTPIAERIAAGELNQCDEDVEAEMFSDAIRILTDKGFCHYEISNFALPGKECLHNLIYWRNQPYLGLGPAAHSYLRGARYANASTLEEYSAGIAGGKLAIMDAHTVSKETEMAETVFLGLRLIKGLNLNSFADRFGEKIEEVYGGQIEGLVKDGLLEYAGGFLRLTERGIALGNRVFSTFV